MQNEDHMERFFRNPHTLQQNRQGPLGPHIDDFAQLLSEQLYTRECARRRLRLIAEFSQWLWSHQLTLGDITVASVNRFLRSRARRRPVGYSSAAESFFRIAAPEGRSTGAVWHRRKNAH